MPQDNKIKIRRGLDANLPAFNTEIGELRYSTDTKKLYIDDGTANIYIAGDVNDFPISTATQNALDLKLEVGDIIGESPISVLEGGVGNNLQIHISKADAATHGYLSASDWNVFNNKQNALGFTPENIANKATNFTTSNDTLYPSVKAVKDQLDLKQKKLSVITITGNTTLSEIHNGAILHITNTCNITIPTGLGANFACDCYVKGAFIATFVNSGVTLNAPSGLLLKTDKMCTLYSNASDTFNLLGELATS